MRDNSISNPSPLDRFAITLRDLIAPNADAPPAKDQANGPAAADLHPLNRDDRFNDLALELYQLQRAQNPVYKTFCDSLPEHDRSPDHWTRIPSLPAAAFKDFEVSCIPAALRTTVFHSSGTTGQSPSRHHHHAASLALYEASLSAWFEHQLGAPMSNIARMVVLTPPPEEAPHSSLVHMFATLARRRQPAANQVLATEKIDPRTQSFAQEITEATEWDLSVNSVASCKKIREAGNSTTIDPRRGRADFVGATAPATGAWELDPHRTRELLSRAQKDGTPVSIMGTAFNFVHLLDDLDKDALRFRLPAGSFVLETGGYKGRSRALPRIDLHKAITRVLGIPPTRIHIEYGMSELSSQAYALGNHAGPISDLDATVRPEPRFMFPPWARLMVLSPDTGRPVPRGEPGLVRIVDLANVWSVQCLQTEDLGRDTGVGLELLGRAPVAEPRGCSLQVS